MGTQNVVRVIQKSDRFLPRNSSTAAAIRCTALYIIEGHCSGRTRGLLRLPRHI